MLPRTVPIQFGLALTWKEEADEPVFVVVEVPFTDGAAEIAQMPPTPEAWVHSWAVEFAVNPFELMN